jgi:hypothetical protein
MKRHGILYGKSSGKGWDDEAARKRGKAGRSLNIRCAGSLAGQLL